MFVYSQNAFESAPRRSDFITVIMPPAATEPEKLLFHCFFSIQPFQNPLILLLFFSQHRSIENLELDSISVDIIPHYLFKNYILLHIG